MATVLQSELSGFQTAPGLGYTVIGCDFPKPLFMLSLHHCQAALSAASEGEAGAQWGAANAHTSLGHFLSAHGPITLEKFHFGTKCPGPLVYCRPVLEVSPAKTSSPKKRYQSYHGS